MRKGWHRKYLGPLEADLEKDLDKMMAKIKKKPNDYEELQNWIDRNRDRFTRENYSLEHVVQLAITVHTSRTFTPEEIRHFVIKKVDLV
jgi:predicted  nucleic acid-binding Zn-ribbon protein